MTIHDYGAKKNLGKDRDLFVNRNHNVVPLHRQNMTPTCGRKNLTCGSKKVLTT